MPIHLSFSRRRFLAGTFATAAAAAFPWRAKAEAKAVDPDSFALLSDCHINSDRKVVVNKANMADQLSQAIAEVIALPKRPAAAFINGDLAHVNGQPGDYATLANLLEPVREAQIPLTLTLGNHDHRANFFAGLKGHKAEPAAVESKHVAVIESPRVNWFLLDTLMVTNKTPGEVGESQLKWLTAELDKHTGKPAIVMAHHTPAPGDPKTTYGIVDTDALIAALLPRRHVKAYIHGHSHDWKFSAMEDLHIVSLPPTAYLFNPAKPSGWIHLTAQDHGATLEVVALDRKHRYHGQITELGWRAG